MLSTTSRVSLRGTALPSAARRAPATAPRTLRVLAYEEGKSTGGETGTAYAKRLVRACPRALGSPPSSPPLQTRRG